MARVYSRGVSGRHTLSPNRVNEKLQGYTGCAIPILDNLKGSKWLSNVLYIQRQGLNIIKKTHHLI